MENSSSTIISARRNSYDLWIAYLIYLIVLAFSISRHELWGDELHSWNIAKGSSGLIDLIRNSRYEGHPPLWYLLLFCTTKLTHDPFYMQCLHFSICALAVFIFLFKCPLRAPYKILILFGYYFIYEYGVLSRNYSVGILFAFLICAHLYSDHKKNNGLYYGYLFLLSNVHLLAFILAVSFHLYFLLKQAQVKVVKQKLYLHTISGLIALTPALYFILPSSDSALNGDFWMGLWTKGQFFVAMQAPLKAMTPIPAWWEYHFWNTHFLFGAQKTIHFITYINPFLSLGVIALVFYMFSKNKTVMLFFACNLFLTLCFALIFPLTTARYVGFILIGFICSLWLASDTPTFDRSRRIILYGLLLLQLFGSVVALKKDWQFPFSRFGELREITAHIPKTSSIITDYWCLNYLSASFDKPFYCVGFDKEKTFLLWDKEMSNMIKKTNAYTNGVRVYFQNNMNKEIYLITTNERSSIAEKDSFFLVQFRAESVLSYTNAIEKGSNIYVYKLSPILRSPPSTN